MAKETIELRSLLAQLEENKARITEIADLCEKEQRERNEAEEVEYRSLSQKNTILEMRARSLSMPQSVAEVQSIDEQFRSALAASVAAGSKTAITLQLRANQTTAQTTSALANTGIIPVQEQEMLDPLRAGLIWDKVGIRISTGKHMRWPSHGKASAAWAGESEILNPTSVDWDKVESTTKRCGIAIDVTRQELEESEGVVANVINSEMPAAIIDKINSALFATDTTGVIYGPFAKAGATGGCDKITFASTSVPTRAEILKMKATVAKKGINPSTCVWVMTETMKSLLEDVKVDAGSGRFLVENDRMLGYPIYCTDAIGDKNIGFGDFSYQACGITGDSVIFDPYTLALSDSSRFVKNSDVTFATLRTDAFVLGVCKATAG